MVYTGYASCTSCVRLPNDHGGDYSSDRSETTSDNYTRDFESYILYDQSTSYMLSPVVGEIVSIAAGLSLIGILTSNNCFVEDKAYSSCIGN